MILYMFVFLLEIFFKRLSYMFNYFRSKKVNKNGDVDKIPDTAKSQINKKSNKKSSKKPNKPYVIGIAGASGSGKSYISDAIMNEIKSQHPNKPAVIINQDNYYIGGNHVTNYDIPESIDFNRLKSDLHKLINGNSIECPIYDFKTHRRLRETTTINANVDIIIVEGILVLYHPEIREFFNVKVFVHADLATCIFRRIRRDIDERKRDLQEVQERYLNHVMPSYNNFVLPSSFYADVCISNSNGSICGKNLIINYISVVLASNQNNTLIK